MSNNEPTQTALELSSSGTERTEWLNGAPPCVGWWETRPSHAAQEHKSPRRVYLEPGRRWFNGTSYSIEVEVGASDEEARSASLVVGNNCPATLQYRGLTAPPAEGYSYSLDATHRTHLAREITSRKRVLLEEET